jgi:hypothetical protein
MSNVRMFLLTCKGGGGVHFVTDDLPAFTALRTGRREASNPPSLRYGRTRLRKLRTGRQARSEQRATRDPPSPQQHQRAMHVFSFTIDSFGLYAEVIVSQGTGVSFETSIPAFFDVLTLKQLFAPAIKDLKTVV